jgi:hypothetical protein
LESVVEGEKVPVPVMLGEDVVDREGVGLAVVQRLAGLVMERVGERVNKGGAGYGRCDAKRDSHLTVK